MFLIKRIQLLTKFILGTLVAIIHVPLPMISTEVLFNLIKKMENCVLREDDGVEDDESVCGEVRCGEQDACSVAQKDGGNDGGPGSSETNGFIKVGESESDESDNDESS